MISIYTHSNNPLTKEFWKWAIKKMLRKYSGPDAVADSLVRGLQELNIPFEINASKPRYRNIHVISGVQALKERISAKTSGQMLLAGPTIVTTPLEHASILLDPSIDIILTPSPWVTDFYNSLTTKTEGRIYSWPSGVALPKNKTDRTGRALIFKKNIDQSVFDHVVQTLADEGVPFDVLEYGTFTHEQYLSKLQTAPYLVYLQKSESQGIALQEAWSYDVPTLVYQNMIWNSGSYSWSADNISAPYLSPQSGLFFTEKDFGEKLKILQSTTLSARQYCETNLSDKVSVTKLFDILKKHNEKTH